MDLRTRQRELTLWGGNLGIPRIDSNTLTCLCRYFGTRLVKNEAAGAEAACGDGVIDILSREEVRSECRAIISAWSSSILMSNESAPDIPFRVREWTIVYPAREDIYLSVSFSSKDDELTLTGNGTGNLRTTFLLNTSGGHISTPHSSGLKKCGKVSCRCIIALATISAHIPPAWDWRTYPLSSPIPYHLLLTLDHLAAVWNSPLVVLSLSDYSSQVGKDGMGA